MGQLRTALRSYVLEEPAPAEVIRRLARFGESLIGDYMATLVYATLDPARGRLRFVNAGHPYPLLIPPDAGPRFLEEVSGPPLGVRIRAQHREAETDIQPGTTVLFYTDGLIERRGERLSTGYESLARAVTKAPAEIDRLCRYLAKTLPEDPPEDDIALLAVQNVGVTEEHLELTVEARAQQLGVVRKRLRGWLSEDATEREAFAIILACSEACANVMEHAYGPEDATFDVRAEKLGREVKITVQDRGQWRAPRGMATRGRGLSVIEAFMDEVEVMKTESGTTVRMSKTLRGEAE
jgi:anti-sigma regulatory factor (Ser/Thr protein kinase)